MIGIEAESTEEEKHNNSSLRQYSGLSKRSIVTKTEIRRKLRVSINSTCVTSNNSNLDLPSYSESNVVSCNDSTNDNSSSSLRTDVKCQDTNLVSSLI